MHTPVSCRENFIRTLTAYEILIILQCSSLEGGRDGTNNGSLSQLSDWPAAILPWVLVATTDVTLFDLRPPEEKKASDRPINSICCNYKIESLVKYCLLKIKVQFQ